LTEDLRHLQAIRGSHGLSGLRNRVGCSIEGADDLGQIQPTDMQIDGGCSGRSVAQKHLDMMEACSCFNQVGGPALAGCLNVWTLAGFLMPARFLAA